MTSAGVCPRCRKQGLLDNVLVQGTDGGFVSEENGQPQFAIKIDRTRPTELKNKFQRHTSMPNAFVDENKNRILVLEAFTQAMKQATSQDIPAALATLNTCKQVLMKSISSTSIATNNLIQDIDTVIDGMTLHTQPNASKFNAVGRKTLQQLRRTLRRQRADGSNKRYETRAQQALKQRVDEYSFSSDGMICHTATDGGQQSTGAVLGCGEFCCCSNQFQFASTSGFS